MLTVRPAAPEDASDIVRVNVHGWQQAYAGIVPEDVLAAMDIEGRTKRFGEVRLWVPVANRQARRFYERAGFTTDGASTRYPVARPDGTVAELPELRYARRMR